MYLYEIIEYLEGIPANTPIPYKLHTPHSWRGSYYELAITYTENYSTAGEWLELLKNTVDTVHEGYKGEDFTMHNCVDVHLVTYEYEIESQPIGKMLLDLLTKKR